MKFHLPFKRRRERERELDEELRAHLAMAVRERIEQGEDPAEAEANARREFGNVPLVKEVTRDQWGWRWLETLLQDLRYGLRQLRRNPGFTIVAVLTLALGIGATTAVFSLLDAVLLRPLPYSHPEQLFRLYPTDRSGRHTMEATSYPDFHDWEDQSRTFESMAAYYDQDFNFTGADQPERLRGLCSTPGLLALLGVHPRLGRAFSPSDGRHVALLSYRLWQRRFAGDPSVLGKLIHLDGWDYTVMGVLPQRFYFPPQEFEGELTAEVFVPAVPNLDRSWNYVRAIGRLAPGVTAQQARTEMGGIAARLAHVYPDVDHGQRVAFGRLDRVAISGTHETAWMLFVAVAFVLLIACANVANLLLARDAAREHEFAVRRIVGATRSRLMRQLLTECVLLAILGGASGVVFANWMLPLVTYLAPQNTMLYTRIHDVGVHLNGSVFLFCAFLVVLSAMLFGVLPTWRATSAEHSCGSTPHIGRIRGPLIGLEVALSIVLLTGAGLMMRSLIRLRNVDVGFRTSRLLTLDVSLPAKRYDSAEKQATFFRRVLGSFGSLPSVLSAAAVTNLPLTRTSTWKTFDIPGTHARQGKAEYNAVSPDYFRTMGISLLSGREIMNSDSAHTPLICVISWRMAQEYWPNRNPVGESIIAKHALVMPTARGTSRQFKPQQLEIVGVVGDVRQLGLDTPPEPETYVPYSQWPSEEMSLVLRTKSEPSSLIPTVEKVIWSVDLDQPITSVRTMDQWVSREAASRRFVLQLIGVFALIAIALAVVGLYGVVSYWTRQRTHEVGIRMALGAEKRDVLRMVVEQGLKLSLIGVVIGVAGAFALTRFLSSLLYGVTPTDLLTFVAVSLILIAVALVACYIPARRAAKVDPMVALRYE